jgi:CYTH domain-containing protein
MAIEIERKFLVPSSDWLSLPAVRIMRVKQGYLAVGDSALAQPETRVRTLSPLLAPGRLPDPTAFITVKGAGLKTRQEVEVSIEPEHAEELLGMCGPRVLLKDRHYLEISGKTWEIDVYRGALEGLVVAEVELSSETEDVDLPAWLGAEVTEDKKFKNASLASAHWDGVALVARQDAASSPEGEPRASRPRPRS